MSGRTGSCLRWHAPMTHARSLYTQTRTLFLFYTAPLFSSLTNPYIRPGVKCFRARDISEVYGYRHVCKPNWRNLDPEKRPARAPSVPASCRMCCNSFFSNLTRRATKMVNEKFYSLNEAVKNYTHGGGGVITFFLILFFKYSNIFVLYLNIYLISRLGLFILPRIFPFSLFKKIYDVCSNYRKYFVESNEILIFFHGAALNAAVTDFIGYFP